MRNEATKAGVLQVLDEVRRNELKRVHGRSALESAAFVDADIPYELYTLKDTRGNHVIGCIRVTRADKIASIAGSRGSTTWTSSLRSCSREPRSSPGWRC